MNITLTQAKKIAELAEIRAKDIGVDMTIVVVDGGANVKFLKRMDNAILASADIALKKARAACLTGMDSGDIGKQSQPGGPFFNIELTNGGLVSFPGGLVFKNESGVIVGAIGVSGGEVEQDLEVATSGAAAFIPYL